MSEQTMGAEMVTPRDRAIAYLEMKQGKRGVPILGSEKNIKARAIPEKVRKRDPLIESVEAYEKTIDTLKRAGQEDLAMAKEELRPIVYERAQAIQMAAKVADIALFWAIPFIPVRNVKLLKTGGMFATMLYRPAEWIASKGFQASVSRDANRVVDNILSGGERVQKAPEPKPVAA